MWADSATLRLTINEENQAAGAPIDRYNQEFCYYRKGTGRRNINFTNALQSLRYRYRYMCYQYQTGRLLGFILGEERRKVTSVGRLFVLFQFFCPLPPV